MAARGRRVVRLHFTDRYAGNVTPAQSMRTFTTAPLTFSAREGMGIFISEKVRVKR